MTSEYDDDADEMGNMEAEIAVARTYLDTLDFSYLVGRDPSQASAADVRRAIVVMTYAMMEIMLSGGRRDPIWHSFLREALDEVIYKASERG